MDQKPKVSVALITYNQERYIKESLNSIFTQKTDFDFEVVIGDDCSTDYTLQIISKEIEQYSNYNLLVSKQNVGMQKNWIRTLQSCKGSYIAICEGDDYWIDENKLQLQYDFMEAHPEVSFCYTNVSILYKDELLSTEMIESKPNLPIFDIEYYINHGNIVVPTLSIFYRKDAIPNPLPEWIYSTFNLDWTLVFFFLQKGKGAFLDKNTGVYRIHPKGINTATDFPKKMIYGIQLAKNLDKYYNQKYHAFFDLQWRYQKLCMYYLQKKSFLHALYYFNICFFRNPVYCVKNGVFLKSVFVLFLNKIFKTSVK